MREREFEDILSRYPELIEQGLTFKGRQVKAGGKFVDLLFEDRHGYKLIVEVKNGTIVRQHVAQLLDYEGYFLSPNDQKVRVMLVGNRVPTNLKRSFDYHGFEWKEIPLSALIDFVRQKGDQEFLNYFAEEDLNSSAFTEEKQMLTAQPETEVDYPGTNIEVSKAKNEKPFPSKPREIYPEALESHSKPRKTKGLLSLQSASTFEELQDVINVRSQQVPTNYMDQLLMENKNKKLSELLRDFTAHAPDYRHFSSVATIKDHIRYRERTLGWVFQSSGDPWDPVVVLVGLKNTKR
jgi:Endonuclease NucS C-terminal domain